MANGMKTSQSGSASSAGLFYRWGVRKRGKQENPATETGEPRLKINHSRFSFLRSWFTGFFYRSGCGAKKEVAKSSCSISGIFWNYLAQKRYDEGMMRDAAGSDTGLRRRFMSYC